MKILKYVLGIIAILGILFLAMGWMNPTLNYGNEVEVDKPLKEAWAVYMDESKMGDWLEGFKSIELISGNKNEVGSQYKLIMEHDGEEMIMTETLTGIKEMEQMSMDIENDFMKSNIKMNFSEKDGKTRIKSEMVGAGKGMFARSLMAISKGSMNEHDLKHLTALKKLIEENTTDYFPQPATVLEGEEISMEEAASQ